MFFLQETITKILVDKIIQASKNTGIKILFLVEVFLQIQEFENLQTEN